jgi:hypothetical protein
MKRAVTAHGSARCNRAGREENGSVLAWTNDTLASITAATLFGARQFELFGARQLPPVRPATSRISMK